MNTNPINPAEMESWQERAACAGIGQDQFFVPDFARGAKKAALERQAKLVCATCPVIAECLEHALSVPEHFGIWGGLTPEERRVILRQRAIRITKENK